MTTGKNYHFFNSICFDLSDSRFVYWALDGRVCTPDSGEAGPQSTLDEGSAECRIDADMGQKLVENATARLSAAPQPPIAPAAPAATPTAAPAAVPEPVAAPASSPPAVPAAAPNTAESDAAPEVKKNPILKDWPGKDNAKLGQRAQAAAATPNHKPKFEYKGSEIRVKPNDKVTSRLRIRDPATGKVTDFAGPKGKQLEMTLAETQEYKIGGQLFVKINYKEQGSTAPPKLGFVAVDFIDVATAADKPPSAPADASAESKDVEQSVKGLISALENPDPGRTATILKMIEKNNGTLEYNGVLYTKGPSGEIMFQSGPVNLRSTVLDNSNAAVLAQYHSEHKDDGSAMHLPTLQNSIQKFGVISTAVQEARDARAQGTVFTLTAPLSVIGDSSMSSIPQEWSVVKVGEPDYKGEYTVRLLMDPSKMSGEKRPEAQLQEEYVAEKQFKVSQKEFDTKTQQANSQNVPGQYVA